jgi:hypothetical protein
MLVMANPSKLILTGELIDSPQYSEICRSLVNNTAIRKVIIRKQTVNDVSIRYHPLQTLLNAIDQNPRIKSLSIGNGLIPAGVSDLLIEYLKNDIQLKHFTMTTTRVYYIDGVLAEILFHNITLKKLSIRLIPPDQRKGIYSFNEFIIGLQKWVSTNDTLENISLKYFRNGQFQQLIPDQIQNIPGNPYQLIRNRVALNYLIWRPQFHFLFSTEIKTTVLTIILILTYTENLPKLPVEMLFLIFEQVVFLMK